MSRTQVKASYQRSVHLERDFYESRAELPYVLTPIGEQILSRVTDVLAGGGQRAWSITGPYGTGKSAFVLFLAKLLRGDSDAWRILEAGSLDVHSSLAARRPGQYLAVLHVGSREPIAEAMSAALRAGIKAFCRDNSGIPQVVLERLKREGARLAKKGVGDREVLDTFERVADIVFTETGGGLLVVLDEFGKMLEYAAMHPDRSDTHILQSFAEKFSRPAAVGARQAPVLFFTILHQSFEAYASKFAGEQGNEWKKIQGRFEDVAFLEDNLSILRLLGDAIDFNGDAPQEDLSWLPRHLYKTNDERVSVEALLSSCFPLHPSVALLLGPLFRKLAQNERSLFAFLSSSERSGFLSIVGEAGSPYRLHHLYDYLFGSLSGGVSSPRVDRAWAEAEAAIQQSDVLGVGADAAALIKQVAIIGLVGNLVGLTATEEVLAGSMGLHKSELKSRLRQLKEARILNWGSFSRAYSIWQGSDFDLESELQVARQTVPIRTAVTDLLQRSSPPSATIAYRHAFERGVNRVFDAVYANSENWREAATEEARDTDGRVIYLLPNFGDDAQALVERVRSELGDPMVLVAIPGELSDFTALVRELTAIDHVRDHSLAARGDAIARLEITQLRSTVSAELDQRLHDLFGGTRGQHTQGGHWIRTGLACSLGDDRELQSLLSEMCDSAFRDSPAVFSELLNRRKPSSSAVRGLKQLVWAMLANPDKENLGIEGHPAEFGMYVSVLRETGLHVRGEQGWAFVDPDVNRSKELAAVWREIQSVLRRSGGRPVPIATLFDHLQRPPLGVRWGLIPVFVFAFLRSRWDEIALFEDGSYVTRLTFETLERLLKSYEKGREVFEIQWVELDESRSELLALLAPVVGLEGGVAAPLPIAMRLLRAIHELPRFVRRTGLLSDRALRVRGTLERAKDPAKLVLAELPMACGLNSVSEATDEDLVAFVETLQAALRELQGAYLSLLEKLELTLAEAFGLSGHGASGRRALLAARATNLLPTTSDLQLKAFLVRASNELLSDQAWLESLATLLTRQPPAQWQDSDVAKFELAVYGRAAEFAKLEPLAYDYAKARGDNHELAGVRRVRILVKPLTETEADGIVHIHEEDTALVESLRESLWCRLESQSESRDIKLAALGEVISAMLRERTVHSSTIDQIEQV